MFNNVYNVKDVKTNDFSVGNKPPITIDFFDINTFFKIITKVELGLLEGLFMGMKTTNDYSLIIVIK